MQNRIIEAGADVLATLGHAEKPLSLPPATMVFKEEI